MTSPTAVEISLSPVPVDVPYVISLLQGIGVKTITLKNRGEALVVLAEEGFDQKRVEDLLRAIETEDWTMKRCAILDCVLACLGLALSKVVSELSVVVEGVELWLIGQEKRYIAFIRPAG